MKTNNPYESNNETKSMNNLYIINEVLFDYTPGMAVISAPSLERCREIFKEEFEFALNRGRLLQLMGEYDSAIEEGWYKVIEGVNQKEGVISYIYGGG